MSSLMNRKHLGIFLLILAFSCSPKTTMKQDEDQVQKERPLLTIGSEEIYADEFLHLLNKNRQFQDKESKITPEEFDNNWDLFINYKLKVLEAENLGLDTVEEFKREFDMFKEDLIKPYLIKNSLQEGELIKAYNRMKEVVKASHILLQFPNNASREDSVAVLTMAMKLKSEAEAGADFNELAVQYSDDPSVQENKGNLGYFTSLQMVYAFEDAAYALKINEVSAPVLTSFGYHIIKLEDRKPNPGEIRVSHILVRAQIGDPVAEERALRKIGDIYTELRKPESVWEEVCQLYSEDLATRNSGGNLPWIGLGAVIPEFERVAFALNEEGEISPPVKTPFGFHIIRLEERKPIASYEEMEQSLKSRILRDSRSTLIQSQVTAIQKSKYGFYENNETIDKLQEIFSLRLEALRKQVDEKQLGNEILFGSDYGTKTVIDFLSFIDLGNQSFKAGNKSQFEAWYEKFVESSLNEAEERDLMANNEEYKLLVKEYRDGILLFSLMNEKVWQKALEDSIGQINFYQDHIDRYQWRERVQAVIVTMGKEEQTNSVRRFLSDKKYLPNLVDRLENTFLLNNPLSFNLQDGVFEWQNHPVLKQAAKTKGFQELKIEGRTYFVVIGENIAPGPKRFEETRGKVIQDYQEYLDKSIVSSLKENYNILINEDEKQKILDLVVNK
jgi:peptidyl-prolyl cis-trans isomerase SurA